jgi:hypothetical protein
MMARVLLVVALYAGVTFGQSAPALVPSVSMNDQFGNTHDVRSYRGHVVVLVYGDKASAKANAAVGETIHVHFHPTAKGKSPAEARRAPVKPVEGAPAGAKVPEVYALPVACIGKVPVGQRIIAAMIRNNSPVVPVLLDFGDVMKTTFPFQAGVPNVVVLDAQGRYRYAAAGTPTPEGTARLLATIEALRKEAVGAK